MLDHETRGMENWRHFARNFDFSEGECKAIKVILSEEYPSPTIIMLNLVVQAYPELTMQEFVRMLVNMERMDVVYVLKKYRCGKHCILNHCITGFFS